MSYQELFHVPIILKIYIICVCIVRPLEIQYPAHFP